MKTDNWLDILRRHNPLPNSGIPGWVLNAFTEYASQFKQPKLPIGEEVKVNACSFLDSIRAYELESGNSICHDERTSEELWDINMGKLDADLNTIEQTQPLSTEVYKQTHGEFMRSNPSNPSINEEKVSTGLDKLIEWMEWESHRRWNESHELPDFTEILSKAKEIKEQLNK